MDENMVKLTVLFEDPFWIGIFERISNGKLTVCKVTFGAEPKDNEICEYILKNYYRIRFSPTVQIGVKKSASNPKRLQKNVKKQLQNTGIGTKSQQALNLLREEMKTERKQISKEMKEADKERMFELKQKKRKEKHRGR